ncbi:MAG: carbohydrate kinase, partial [Oscillospiraceae bacterium]
MDFLSVGEMVIDFLPGNEAGVYIRKAGGAPANVAIALARQGCDAAFCGMMGNDDFGRFLLETLRDNGVKPLVTDLTNDAITTMAFVTLNEFGDRSFTFARKPGADMFLNRSHIKDEYLDNTSIVHAGSCSLSKGDAVGATVYALQEGCRRGKLVSFDVNYRNLLWDNDRTAASVAVMKILPFVDILKISEDEIDMIGGEEEIPKLMRECDIAMVVETLGANGARCFWNGEIISLDGIKAECVDATGAGDAFWGGF